jgi:GMP synthase-like glutamine amidotransferase
VTLTANGNGREVLVLEHQPDDPAGLIGEWLTDRGTPWRTVTHDEPEPDPTSAAALVTLGSSCSAYATQPSWIPRHIELLRGAIDVDVPVLGICFGAQALAIAAGGTVGRARSPEVGWVSPDSDAPELRGPWLAWHFDAIEAPADAVELARSPNALQAYTVGCHVGLQFHPEVTPPIWNAWAGREHVTAREYTGDPAAFTAELHASAEPLRARVYALLDWWRERLTGH